MALLTYNDIQEALNIDLTSPNGQSLATSLIAAAVSYAEQVVGFPLEAATVTEYFDGESNRLWLNTSAPVSNLTLAQYNSITRSYDDIDSLYLRHSGNEVYSSYTLPSGFQSVRATYTTGWTTATVPGDLKRALIDLVGLKLQEVTNFSSNPDDPTGAGTSPDVGALKRVSSGAYSEEYSSTGSEVMWKAKAAQLSRTIGDGVPAGMQEMLARYRQPFAL